jgi:hypothetical protein
MFAVVALGSAVVANADSVIINVPNAGLSGTPGPYATVNYVLNGSNIDVTVTMFPGFAAFGTGDANNGIFGFNVVGSTAGLNITNLPAGFAFNAAGGQMDGFGKFRCNAFLLQSSRCDEFQFHDQPYRRILFR